MVEYLPTKRRLSNIWKNMIHRCYNKNDKYYEYYGGKGVTVCHSWKRSFASFCVWALMNGYQNDLTLERIDLDKNYTPENCKWTTYYEQSRNKSQTVKVNILGIEKCFKDWCHTFGVKPDTAYARMSRGKTPIEALGFLSLEEAEKRLKEINA